MSFARVLATAAALAPLALLSACKNPNDPSPNMGRTTTADPAKRQSQEIGLASKDVVDATDQMVQDIAAKPEFHNPPYRINIVMDRVVNKTSLPSRNYDIYLARIRTKLNESGTRYNLGFVLNRDSVVALREKEGLEPPAGSIDADKKFKSKADYALRGEFYDMPNVGNNYYLLTFQIIDLHDGEIVFEGSYEVKFS